MVKARSPEPDKTSSKAPMLVVKLTPDLKTMLEQYKERTGSSYANTVRTALFALFAKESGRISPRPAPYPKAALKGNAPTRGAGEARDTIRTHFGELLGHLKTVHGGEYAPVRAAIEAEIPTFSEDFKLMGYEPGLDTVIELIVLGPDTPTALKDYARGVLDPLTRKRGKGKKPVKPKG